MTPLVHVTDVSSSYCPEDVDFVAFIEPTSLIGAETWWKSFLLASCGLSVNNLVLR
jgi:hypothetical protein